MDHAHNILLTLNININFQQIKMKNNTEDIENISPSLSKIDSEEVPKENEHQRIKMDDLNLEPESLTTKVTFK